MEFVDEYADAFSNEDLEDESDEEETEETAEANTAS